MTHEENLAFYEDGSEVKKIFPNCNERIVYAFTLNGTPYFEYSDFTNMGVDRAFAAVVFHNELASCVTRDYLKEHCTAVSKVLNDPAGIKLTDIAELNSNLQNRLELLHEPDIALKLATVVFFDGTESPFKYDYAYGIEKLNRFKSVSSEDFFFTVLSRKQLGSLVPQNLTDRQDFQVYSQVVRALTDKHQRKMNSILGRTSVQQSRKALSPISAKPVR